MLLEMFILKIESLVENLRSMPFEIRNFKKERKLLFLEIVYFKKTTDYSLTNSLYIQIKPPN